MNSETTPEVIAVSIEEAARLLGISRAQYYKLLKLGKVPAPVVLGRRRLVSVEALRKLVNP